MIFQYGSKLVLIHQICIGFVSILEMLLPGVIRSMALSFADDYQGNNYCCVTKSTNLENHIKLGKT